MLPELTLRLVILAYFLHPILADLSTRLKHYEVLHHTDIIGLANILPRQKRALDDENRQPDAIKHLEFTTSGRHFKLSLTENKELFGPNFSVKTINSLGIEEAVDFNPHAFYKGVVLGEVESEVFLHMETEESINAKIVTPSETYYIEPSHPHLPLSSNYSMISHKASHLIFEDDVKSYCGGVKHGVDNRTETSYVDTSSNSFTVPLHDQPHEYNHDRSKRQTSSEVNTCSLLLVVDHRFLVEIMGNDTSRASNYVVDLISRVNSIYRSTKFGLKQGFGLQIANIKIHSSYSNDPDHYNYGNRNIVIVEDSLAPNPINVLLDAFGRVDKSGNTDYTQYCLAHLFTAYAFGNGVLGLAYIASPSRTTYGGICSRSYYDPNLRAEVYLNTGWSSAYNRHKQKILTQEAEIVLAHELGHNWGSEHDPDTSTCSPSGADGKYIMYTYSVDGFQPNNKKFSECSKASIGLVLENKANLCFSEMTISSKGNFNRDEGEDCDAGRGGNQCCTPDQTYTRGSDCSPPNDVCCQDCSIQSALGNICASESDLTCVATSRCNGRNRTCDIKYKEQGATCQEGFGRCGRKSDGIHCLSIAEVLGLDKCTCTDEDKICHLCHRNINGACVQFNPKEMNQYVEPCPSLPGQTCSRRNGRPLVPFDINLISGGDNKDFIILARSACAGGYCDTEGVCQKQSTDLVARFWDFLTHLDPNAFVEFMEDNIVGTVAVFSLILWLPCVIAIHCYDKKQAEKAELEETAIRSLRRHPAEERRMMVSRPLLH